MFSLKAAFYHTVIEDDTEPKVPLTAEQEESLLSFMWNDTVYQKYRDTVNILLGTGLHISGLCGLTGADIDLENGVICVGRQLLKSKGPGNYVGKPKTQSGIQKIPMVPAVWETLERVLKSRKKEAPSTVDGYSGFLFCSRNGKPRTVVSYGTMFRGLTKKYNKAQGDAPLKAMAPHTLRDTFCTGLANAGMATKALQYIMGHSNITMTLDYYARAMSDSARAEMEPIEAGENLDEYFKPVKPQRAAVYSSLTVCINGNAAAGQQGNLIKCQTDWKRIYNDLLKTGA